MRSAIPMPCSLAPLSDCQNLTTLLEGVVRAFQVGLVLYAPPLSIAAREQQLESDLAAASAATITMMHAALNGDEAGWASASVSFGRALDAVDTDANAILAT